MASPRQQQALSAGGAALLLLVALGLGAEAVQQYDEQVTVDERLTDAQQAASAQLRRARDSLALSEQVSAQYRALEQAGLFSAIDKPRAIDHAESALRPFLASVSRFQIGGTHEVAPAPLAQASRYQVEMQRVAVDFEPLHEERFLDVWDALAALRGPVGAIENCELHRPSAEGSVPGTGSDRPLPLKAHCLLTWYRLQAAPAPSAAPAPPPAEPESRKAS